MFSNRITFYNICQADIIGINRLIMNRLIPLGLKYEMRFNKIAIPHLNC
jgi:hypothetical protein